MGKMGQEVLRALTPADGFEVLVAVDKSGAGSRVCDVIGQGANQTLVTEKLGASLDANPVDVLVDFSHHSAAAIHAMSAIDRGISPVIGCTGLSDTDMREIKRSCQEKNVPGMYIPNFAVGAVLMMRFAQMAAKWLPDVEIIELHHDRKEDAPSGTAMLTANLISQARTEEPTRLPRPLIKAEGARGAKVNSVPVHSVRLPGFVAHQQVIFGGTGEVLTIRHDSMDRKSFMQGVKLAVRGVRSQNGFVVGLDRILFG
jgi:4-hydroxy-tetrahydrodipicolinate reductase